MPNLIERVHRPYRQLGAGSVVVVSARTEIFVLVVTRIMSRSLGRETEHFAGYVRQMQVILRARYVR